MSLIIIDIYLLEIIINFYFFKKFSNVVYASNSKGKQTAQQSSPIKNNTLTIAFEAKMIKLKTLVTKMFNILETCTIILKAV